jgi:hypothetical protein
LKIAEKIKMNAKESNTRLLKYLEKTGAYLARHGTPDILIYRFQQLFILVAHLVLLKWMIYSLSESGTLPILHVLGHFVGMATYGGALIRGTAYWAQRRYRKETQQGA